jgi:hypothetical protein
MRSRELIQSPNGPAAHRRSSFSFSFPHSRVGKNCEKKRRRPRADSGTEYASRNFIVKFFALIFFTKFFRRRRAKKSVLINGRILIIPRRS